MSFNTKQFKKVVVKPTLKKIDMYSESAVNLLLGTMAQESHFGTYIKQLGGGPALGVYQMEPNTHNDIVNNYIKYRAGLKNKLSGLGYNILTADELIWDLQYATVFCRLHYRRVPKPLPPANDIRALAAYWKKYYNTYLGKGTEEDFVKNYKKYVK